MDLVLSLVLALSMGQLSAPAATGGISGRVVAEGTNAPIAGARIILFPAGRPIGPFGPVPQTTTDEDGRFAFTNLAPGEHRIDVQKAGFAPLNEPATPPRTVTVVAGTPASVELHLQRGGILAGRVLDPKGEPLAGARVMAMRRVPNRQDPAALPRLIPAPPSGSGSPPQTNDLGEFRVAGLAPGEYVIAVVPHALGPMGGAGVTPPRPGNGARKTTVTTFYPGTTDQAAAQTVIVAAGAEVSNIVFTVQSGPAFRVSGIVVDENGAPVDDAMVVLMVDSRTGGPMLGPAGGGRSDANGRFAIDDVPPGTYRANASVMMRFSSGGIEGRGSGAGTAPSSGYVSFSTITTPGPPVPSAEIVVSDADVKGVRVVARRPVQQ